MEDNICLVKEFEKFSTIWTRLCLRILPGDKFTLPAYFTTAWGPARALLAYYVWDRDIAVIFFSNLGIYKNIGYTMEEM